MRIANMVEQGIDPECLLSVTFTNKAANEMRERIGDILGKEKAKKITMGTFHAFCLRLLREHAEAIGYKKSFTIYSQGEQQALVKKLLTRLLTKEEALDPGVALSKISKAKNSEIERERLGDPMKTLLGALFQLYTDEMRALNAMDFDDLLLNAVILLEDHPEVREAAQAKYRFVMVDEFQDTNTLQMRMLRALVPPPHNICVVGDDDQSIYGWRGADITNINEFESFFPDPAVIKLEENYRSTTPILHTANSLIKHNAGRRGKSLWSQNKGQDPVRIVTTEDEKEEATLIADEMLEMNGKGDKFDDMAVLFRTNDQSRVLEGEFRKRKIPYRIVGARSFFDRSDVKDIIAYLSVIQNNDDDVSLLRIINTPTRGIGESTRELARHHSIEKNCSVFEALKDREFQSLLSDRAKLAIGGFMEIIEHYSGMMGQAGADYAPFAERLLEDLKFREHLAKSVKNDEDLPAAEIGMNMLLDSLKNFDDRKRPGQDLQTFLDEVSLNDDREEKDDITKKTGVCLITLHAAKGLEFPIVYLPGLEEGIIPHRRSILENTKDEERRLFYVGITRAMRKLTLSYARFRVKWGKKETCAPSSFIRELDDKYLETFDHGAFMKEEVSVEEGLSYFQMLKKQLAEG
jgi:DNA helicase-2/ATP-dependent DNA helicase PcrA